MKHMRRILASLAVVFMLAAGLVLAGYGEMPAQAAGGADDQNSFYLAASISSRPVIEPARVTYKKGQTIRQALAESGYRFGGIDQFYISDIEGIAGNYFIYYDKGGYDLDQPAESATAILFSERENAGEDDLAMIKAMYDFLQKDNHVQEYVPAEQAYQNCLTGLRMGGSDAKALIQALNQACSDYEALFDGPKYKLTLTVKQGEKVLTKPHVSLKDAYGNVYEEDASSMQVIAGLYEFQVSDGGMNSVTGSISISKNATLDLSIPQGDWFAGLNLLDSTREAYHAQVDLKAGKAVYLVPDTSGKNQTILNALMGTGIPDEDNTELMAVYTNRSSGNLTTKRKISWESQSASLSSLVLPDCQDTEFTIIAQYVGADGYNQRQTIACQILRMPTLTGLTVSADGTKLPLAFDPLTNAYQIPTVSKNIKVTASPMDPSYQVEGTGSFEISGGASGTTREITLTGPNGQTNTYSLHFQLEESVPVTLKVPSGCSAKVYNNADSEIKAVDGTYHLIPGADYYYISTKQKEYHARASFKAAKDLQVEVQAPMVEEALTDLAIYNDSNYKSRLPFPADSAFSPDKHDYIYTPMDAYSAAYAQATKAEGYTATMIYQSQTTSASTHDLPKTAEITNPVNATGTAKNIPYLLGKCGYSQNGLLRLSRTVGDVTYYQDYRLAFHRLLHISRMEVSDSYGPLTFFDAEGNIIDFKRDLSDIYVSVDRSTKEIGFDGAFVNELDTTPVCGGYSALIRDQVYESLAGLVLSLDESIDEEIIEIMVRCLDENSIPMTYKLHVIKTDPVPVTFKTEPEEASIYMINNATGRRISKEEGVFNLTPGAQYSLTITAVGYVGQQMPSYTAPAKAETVNIQLQKAPDNPGLLDLEAQWPGSRADQYNNGVVSAKTPISAEDASLSWATRLGEGYSNNACGCPILVDGYLYDYAGTSIFKVDTVSGQVVAEGEMDHKSSFAINAPTYAEGMIFVGLADGTIQAFNADTLESLWIYHDPLKGQPNCPIVYHDGHIYSGFWLGETSAANYVCLSITDEDPDNPKEEKVATWRYKHNGFYWAGAYVCDNYLLIGTDDGASGYLTGHASILSLNPVTGEVIDSFTLKEPGDQRSGITFVPDADNSLKGYGYFTTKGGYFYRIRVNEDGSFSDNKVRSMRLYNYADNASAPPMSTCTPVVYKDRAYIGVSGTGQFGAYSGHNITVIDLEHWTIAYTVRTQGYPQTSGLLTTGYEEETGDIYVYFVDNYTPGKIRVLKDHKGQTKPELVGQESYTEKGETTDYEVAYTLFTPDGAQAQYAICSPITDQSGTIYLKNDSAYLMAVAPSVKELELTEEPDRLDYQVGDVFDGSGMKVTAVYSNGFRRDVTDYVTWSEEALSEEDSLFTVEFPYTMYHDGEEGPGEPVDHPYVTVNLNMDIQEEGGPRFTWTQLPDLDEAGQPVYKAEAVWSKEDAGTEEDLVMECQITKEVTKEASCESKGRLTYTASVTLNDKTFTSAKNVILPLAGHDIQEYEGKAASCEEAGWQAYEACSRCDYTTYQEIPALGHEWNQGEETKPATETETGIFTYTCTRCHATKEEVLPLKEHVHVKENLARIPASFTKAGKKAGTKCSICGKILSGRQTIPKAPAPKLTASSFIYNGKAIKAGVKITGLKAGTDYSLTYKNNKLVGKATVTVKLKGAYTGSKKLTYKIYPANISLKALSGIKKGFKASWNKKTAQVSGYQIRYSTSSKMTKAKTLTIKSAKTVTKKVQKLKTKTKYYVQIRTYKDVNKTRYQGKWSKAKAVKTK